MKKLQCGFSLMELMIVIGIIGILVAIAIPSYKTYTRRAHYTEVVQAAAPYKIGVEECYQITGSLKDCKSGSNGVPPAIPKGQSAGLVNTVQASSNGVITITPQEKYGISTKDTYILTPRAEGGSLQWTSGGGSVAQGYAN